PFGGEPFQVETATPFGWMLKSRSWMIQEQSSLVVLVHSHDGITEKQRQCHKPESNLESHRNGAKNRRMSPKSQGTMSFGLSVLDRRPCSRILPARLAVR